MRTRFLLLAALALSTCATAVGALDPSLVRETQRQIKELQQKLDGLQKAEQNAQQLDQLKTEQARLGPIVSMARQYDGRIDVLQQKVAGADAALDKAQKEWSEFANSGAMNGDAGMQILDLLRGVSLLETANRDRLRTLASALLAARSARAQVEPDIAELKKLLLEQKKLRECPDPDYAGKDLQACEARLAELNQLVPPLSKETVTARGDRVAEINRLENEIAKLNRELADGARTPANKRPAAQPGPRIPTIEVTWPDKQRIAEGVWPATPEAGIKRLVACTVSLKVTLHGLDPTFVPRLQIDVEGLGTFWGFPSYRPENGGYADFEVYVPVAEGPFAMTISVPKLPGCQPVTIRSKRLRPDDAPNQQRMNDRVNRIQQLQQELQTARTERQARDKHDSLADELALFASDLTKLSHFAEALQQAVVAVQHFQASGNAGNGDTRQFIQELIATAAFVGGDVQILEGGLSASAEYYRQKAEHSTDRSKADLYFSEAGDYYKLAGNCIATIGGESELPRARAAWRKALECEARCSHPDTRCPAWTKE
jgi:hypothetical protein